MAGTAQLPKRRRGNRCQAGILESRLSPEEAEQLSDNLQILAHPVRLQILALLARHEGQVCVCDLEAALPVKQPTVSHHLKLLQAAGLIDCERHGLWSYYFLNREALARICAHLAQRFQVLA